MRPDALRYLVCPSCHGELRLLNAATVESGRIWTADLRCRACDASYPVQQAVPRFPLAPDTTVRRVTARTRRTYDFTWQRVASREFADNWPKDSRQYLALIPQELISGSGRVGLEVGCGGGTDLMNVAAGGAELIGLDLTDAVVKVAHMTSAMPNVSILQADVHNLPFRAASFDFIYSFGVLHHLSDPRVGFSNLARLLKPGAPLITYLYEDFRDHSALERFILAVIRLVRHVTSRLPPVLLYGLCWMAVPVVWFCSVSAHLMRAVSPRLAARIPFRHTLRWPVLASDLFDRFAPPIEWRFDRHGVLELYERAGFRDVTIVRHRGWVSWGFRSGGVWNPAASTADTGAAVR